MGGTFTNSIHFTTPYTYILYVYLFYKYILFKKVGTTLHLNRYNPLYINTLSRVGGQGGGSYLEALGLGTLMYFVPPTVFCPLCLFARKIPADVTSLLVGRSIPKAIRRPDVVV